jgi:putative FmdB family regulatory protein
MPTYGYRCPSCGHEYEKFQKITDRSRKRCPNCGGLGERLISGGAGIVFKGSGFYATDYGGAGKEREKQESSKSEPTEKSTSSEKKGKGSEKKPAKKSGDGDAP